jgi:hypothetical protein
MAGLANPRGDSTLLAEIIRVRAGMLIQKLQKTEKIADYCKKLKVYDLCDINNADETGLFFSIQPSNTLTFQEHLPWWYKS